MAHLMGEKLYWRYFSDNPLPNRWRNNLDEMLENAADNKDLVNQ